MACAKVAHSAPLHTAGGAFADNGCEVHYTVGEADREMVWSCLEHPHLTLTSTLTSPSPPP